MNTKLFKTFAVASVVLLTLLTTTSLRAGTITIVNMPATGTDAGSGINSTNSYVCAFDYGDTTSAGAGSINSVPFTHFQLAANVVQTTNMTDANFGGQVVLSAGGPNNSKVASTHNTTGLSTQADGNMVKLLTDCVYAGAVSVAGDWIKQEFDNLTPGDQYSLRIYYRRWNNEGSVRNNSFTYSGGDTTNLTVTVDPDTGGAHYIEYDFTAYHTNVFCVISNLLVVTTQQPWLLYGATLQNTFSNLAPFIVQDASVSGIGNGVYQFSVQAVPPPLAYQWYFNTTSNYSGATMSTDGNDYSGSTSNILTATNNLLDYYFVIVTNNYGSVTSSIVQINPDPVITTQPTSTNVGNAYVAFNMTAGGFLPLTYQWYFNTTSNYSGATMATGDGYSGSTTNSLATTTNLQDYYFVVVTNNYGSVTSSIAAYYPYPAIVMQPVPFIAGTSIIGGSIGFTNMSASGWPTLGYQWYFNTVSNYTGANILTDGSGVFGSSTTNLTITNAPQSDYVDYYFVVATNYYGSITSRVVQAISQLTAVAAGEPIWNQTSQTNIIVTFSDRLDPITATTLGNYSLNNGASVSSAVIGGSNEVVLTTSPLSGSYTLTVSNVNDYFGLTMSPSPTNLTVGVYPENLALWVRADTYVTADVNGNVSEWDDMSGNVNNLYTISALAPQLATNAYGDPVIHFTATNSTEMDASSSPTLAITGDLSIIAVMNFAAASGDIVSKTSSANKNIAAPYDCYMTATGDSLYRGNGNGTTAGVNYGSNSATNAPSIGRPHILTISESGNTVSHFLDGNAAGTGLLGSGFQEANDLDAGQDLTVGWRAYGDMRLTGDISELIIAGSAISSYDVTQLDNYLITKHNIVFFNISPTNLVFSASGGNLTLSWPADHTGWRLLAQTNSLTVGLTTNWATVANSTTTNQMIIPINQANGSVFYRLVYP